MNVEEHVKGWGKEIWIVNSDLYCGKKLILSNGKRCSIHYHKIKDETFYIQRGMVQMDVYLAGYPGSFERRIMIPGDVLHIPPHLPHQFLGLEDSEIFEFSTQHFEEDSYRYVRGD